MTVLQRFELAMNRAYLRKLGPSDIPAHVKIIDAIGERTAHAVADALGIVQDVLPIGDAPDRAASRAPARALSA